MSRVVKVGIIGLERFVPTSWNSRAVDCNWKCPGSFPRFYQWEMGKKRTGNKETMGSRPDLHRLFLE